MSRNKIEGCREKIRPAAAVIRICCIVTAVIAAAAAAVKLLPRFRSKGQGEF